MAALNAVIPPVLAALRLPLTLVLGFLLVLLADAGILLSTDALTDGMLTVDGFGWALLAALVVAAVSVVLAVFLGSDDTYSIRIAQRIAPPAGHHRRGPTSRGSSSSRSTGSRCRCCGARCATATPRTWRAGWPRARTAWPSGRPTSRRRPGASQAGILLGSNEDIPAFRWVEKETATLMTCSAPPDCAEIERRRATGIGLLVDGGSSRGNLLSGEADEVILTVSRMDAEKRSNPGYRAFLANGDNVTRTLVLFGWEVVLEWIAAVARDPARRAPARAPRRHLPADARRRCASSCAT